METRSQRRKAEAEAKAEAKQEPKVEMALILHIHGATFDYWFTPIDKIPANILEWPHPDMTPSVAQAFYDTQRWGAGHFGPPHGDHPLYGPGYSIHDIGPQYVVRKFIYLRCTRPLREMTGLATP